MSVVVVMWFMVEIRLVMELFGDTWILGAASAAQVLGVLKVGLPSECVLTLGSQYTVANEIGFPFRVHATTFGYSRTHGYV